MEENTSKVYVGTAGPTHLMAGTSGAGSALFVINLCASIAPVQLSGKNLPGLENYRLYQVSRVEDGRTRHRLRLGFFASESHAESVLTVVRQQYPTAFTTCLCDEDRRFTRGYLPENAAASTAAAARPAVAVVAPTPAPAAQSKQRAPSAPAKTAPVRAAQHAAPAKASVPASPAPSVAHGKPARPAASKTLSPAAPRAIELPSQSDSGIRLPALTLSEPAPVPPEAKTRVPSQPFHVGRGIDIADAGLRLQPDPPEAKATPAASNAGARPSAPGNTQVPVAKATSAARTAPAAKSPSMGRQPAPVSPPKKPGSSIAAPRAVVTPIASASAKAAGSSLPPRTAALSRPDLDSTQTIRALTSAELNDETQEKWFAIQLAASEQPVNLDTMPHLDIFEAYRLYSVAIAGSGKIVHSLRLGFFREAVSAEAVGGYLKTFFGSPTVLRVSAAEQARFKEPLPRQPPAAACMPKPEAKVVELSDARAARPVVPTVTMEVAAPRGTDTGATGSFRPDASGSFNVGATGSHRTLTPALKPAARSAGAVRRSEPVARSKSATGKYKMPQQKKSLSQQLLDEAREVELSESGIRKLPKNDSLLSRLVGRLTK